MHQFDVSQDGSECIYLDLCPRLMIGMKSIPVALQYEKFHIPDAIRVLDAVLETLTY